MLELVAGLIGPSRYFQGLQSISGPIGPAINIWLAHSGQLMILASITYHMENECLVKPHIIYFWVIPYKINKFSKILPDDHLGFSSFLDMLVHVIKELHMQNYRSVPQTVPEIWLI